MIIAVNTNSLLTDCPEDYNNFIWETISRISTKHPEHQFIFITDKAYHHRFVSGNNIKTIVVKPPAHHPLFWKIWYDIKLPALLKKHKANVLVCGDGICSLRTTIPQCLLLPDLDFLHQPSFIKKTRLSYYKKSIPTFLNKVRSIATFSLSAKNELQKKYALPDDKIDVLYSAANEIFIPIDFEEKLAVKEKYTQGKEYFLYSGIIHPVKNLVTLLKAFSLFKKMQRSNMKLVLAGRVASSYASFTESLSTYKYRDDVVITGDIPEDELAPITAAAYALVNPSLYDSFALSLLQGMQCKVPIIVSNLPSMEEIAADAAVYFDPADINALADQLKLIYKDENGRKDLIQKGEQQVKQFSWDKTADLLWQTILKAVH